MPERAKSELGEPAQPEVPVAGVTGELVKAFDWSRTALGPAHRWSFSLRSIVSTLLHSRHPMFLFWGPELIQIYNDAYMPSFGLGKHPKAMGQRGADCWHEIWPIIWPQIDDVMSRGRASWNEDHLVPILRNQRIEEVYWTYGYSPVFDDDGSIGGTLVVCTETTARVVSERRLRTLSTLGEQLARVTDEESMLRCAAGVLEQSSNDLPFALVYVPSADAEGAQLVEAVGSSQGDAREILGAELAGRVGLGKLRDAAESGEPIHVPDARLPGGPWPEPASQLFVAAIRKESDQPPSAFLVVGLSPRLPFDESYREYITQIAERIAATHARLEAQRVRRAVIEELEAANRTKDEFLAMLGHELRNPLSPIVTALDLKRMRNDGVLVNEDRAIERQVRHLVRLVDDLLDVARITRGDVELRRETIDVASVIRRAVEISTLLFEERKHELEVEASEGMMWFGDATRLAQVIANLLTNAARYTDPGGHVKLEANLDGGNVVIRVSDDGIGIAPEMMQRIFEPFVQGGRRVDRAHGGLGIGLALVKNLVGLHGGTVHGESEGLGRGSAFTLRLPAESTEVKDVGRSLASRNSTPKSSSQVKRILIVDDNVDAGELLANGLGRAGHDVRLADSAESALEHISSFVPDVAVLDIGLPDMDGYELASRIRSHPAGASIRLIALTGYGQAHDRRRSGEAGFAHHLVKPVDFADLLEVM